jgi:hypothetical protein
MPELKLGPTNDRHTALRHCGTAALQHCGTAALLHCSTAAQFARSAIVGSIREARRAGR